MSQNRQIVCENGLQFFGKMTASISHEIKNVLAIINENAGMLEDYIYMEQKGIPLTSEKVGRVAKQVLKQIQRADGIIKKMNRFSHSIDAPLKQIDVCDTVRLVIALSQRFATNRGVAINYPDGSSCFQITTHPFFLENLIWQCIDRALTVASGKSSAVSLCIELKDRDTLIRLNAHTPVTEGQHEFPSHIDRALADALSARLFTDDTKGEIIVYLPPTVGS